MMVFGMNTRYLALKHGKTQAEGNGKESSWLHSIQDVCHLADQEFHFAISWTDGHQIQSGSTEAHDDFADTLKLPSRLSAPVALSSRCLEMWFAAIVHHYTSFPRTHGNFS